MKRIAFFPVAIIITFYCFSCASTPTSGTVNLGIYDVSVPAEDSCILEIPRYIRIKRFDLKDVDWFTQAYDQLKNKKWYSIQIPAGTRLFHFDITADGYTEQLKDAWILEAGKTYVMDGNLGRFYYGQGFAFFTDKQTGTRAKILSNMDRDELSLEIQKR